MKNKIDRIIVALDQMSLEEIDTFLSQKNNSISIVKIGLELFLKHGRELVIKINSQYNKRIFLDLKLHDIPVTVEKAIASLAGLPIDFLTVHLSGGSSMLEAAIKSRDTHIPNCKILGVSFLTSLESQDLKQLFGIDDTDAAFTRLFKIADKCAIDGVVCSPHEVGLLKSKHCKLLAVTPGIRFQDEIENSIVQDQKRVMDPLRAMALGADYLVMGRSLTKASNLSERLSYLSQ